MERFVKLDRLPDGYQFPQHLKEKIQFDAEGHRLVFRGYMSKSDFDRLCQPTHDWAFRRCVEELFRLCVADETPAPGGTNRVAGMLARLFPVGKSRRIV